MNSEATTARTRKRGDGKQRRSNSTDPTKSPRQRAHMRNSSIASPPMSPKSPALSDSHLPLTPGATPVPLPAQTPQTTTSKPYNVLIFGQTGTGKSSLVNMIAGHDIAITSNNAVGCTFGSASYDVSLSVAGRPVRLWDTAGLNEASFGTMSSEEAVESLKHLVAQLQGQIDLLIYCITGGRLKEIVHVNYDLFNRVVCQKKVPIVLAVTGLELEEEMENWWVENQGELESRGMRFVGHACITTTKGKFVRGEYQFQEEYDHSQEVVRNLLLHTSVAFPTSSRVAYKDVWRNVSVIVSAWLSGTPPGRSGSGQKPQRSNWICRYAAKLGMTVQQAWDMVTGGPDRTQPGRFYH